MNETFRKQAEEWFERGRHDIETAQLLYDEQGYTDSIAYHVQQALEKYLKGYLVLDGKKPPKIHELLRVAKVMQAILSMTDTIALLLQPSIDTLLNHVASFDKSLSEFLSLCEKASRYYIEDRYPPGPLIQYERSELKTDLKRAQALINRILGKSEA